MSLPDRFDVEPIIAWRTWFADWDGVLYSPAQQTEWPLGERLEADCYQLVRSVSHRATNPDARCKCGVYAFKEPIAAGCMYAMVEDNFELLCPPGLHPVLGQVALWGRIFEHTEGYRAQYAYPHMLRTPREALARRLRQNYGVEVECTS